MTDEKIVELYWERSEEAIKETDKQYGRYFHNIAKEILQDEEDAKEIVNDTYLKAWNSIPPERPKPLKAFLGRITRQLSINRLERNKAQKRGGGQYLLALDELAECIPDSSGSKDFASDIDLSDTINRFLRGLPIEQRRVFIKRYWYMSSIADTAASLLSVLSRAPTVDEMAAELTAQLDSVYALWQQNHRAFLEEYRRHCINLGKSVSLIKNGLSRSATALDIDSDYALVVEYPDGQREHIHTGEVSLR